MKIKTIIYLFLLLPAVPGVAAAAEEESGKETKDKSIQAEEKFRYTGARYRSPFSPASSSGSSGFGSLNTSREIKFEPDVLKVTGVFSDPENKYVILSGSSDYFIVKRGRVYNEEEKEVPGVAAVIEKDKIVLIMGDNKVFEIGFPE